MRLAAVRVVRAEGTGLYRLLGIGLLRRQQVGTPTPRQLGHDGWAGPYSLLGAGYLSCINKTKKKRKKDDVGIYYYYNSRSIIKPGKKDYRAHLGGGVRVFKNQNKTRCRLHILKLLGDLKLEISAEEQQPTVPASGASASISF